LFNFILSFSYPLYFGEGWGEAKKKTAHRDSMSRFPILGNSVSSLHGCKKLLCHHQKFVFCICFIFLFYKKTCSLQEQAHFEIFLKNTNMAL